MKKSNNLSVINVENCKRYCYLICMLTVTAFTILTRLEGRYVSEVTCPTQRPPAPGGRQGRYYCPDYRTALPLLDIVQCKLARFALDSNTMLTRRRHYCANFWLGMSVRSTLPALQDKLATRTELSVDIYKMDCTTTNITRLHYKHDSVQRLARHKVDTFAH